MACGARPARRRRCCSPASPASARPRTAAELARRAHDDGALVLYGHCDEGLGAPYQPFAEALRWYTDDDNVDGNVGPLGRLPGELTRLLPDLPTGSTASPSSVGTDPGSEEHRLFEADHLVAPRRGRRARGWSSCSTTCTGPPSPRCCSRSTCCARRPRAGAPLLVLITYRDTDIDRANPLFKVLADLRDVPGVDRVPVDNLTADDVVALMEASAGHADGRGRPRPRRRALRRDRGQPVLRGRGASPPGRDRGH